MVPSGASTACNVELVANTARTRAWLASTAAVRSATCCSSEALAARNAVSARARATASQIRSATSRTSAVSLACHGRGVACAT